MCFGFYWITNFGVPEAITSDRGLQFTSNVWSLLCEMLHITHRQTTAFPPESNGAVERLHRRLKDALHACTTAATWAKETPWVLLSLCVQPRGDTVLSSAEAVFGAQIVLPNEFLQGEKFLLTQFQIFFYIFGCTCFFFAQAQFVSPAAE
jgi:hypothetical protein